MMNLRAGPGAGWLKERVGPPCLGPLYPATLERHQALQQVARSAPRHLVLLHEPHVPVSVCLLVHPQAVTAKSRQVQALESDLAASRRAERMLREELNGMRSELDVLAQVGTAVCVLVLYWGVSMHLRVRRAQACSGLQVHLRESASTA